MRLCSRYLSTDGCDADWSPTTPGQPGRRQQMPRTTSSMATPACDARYSASITDGSTSGYLTMIRAARPRARCALALDQADDLLAHPTARPRASSQRYPSRSPWQVEQSARFLTHVGLRVNRPRSCTPAPWWDCSCRSRVDVAADAVALATHHQRGLAVALQTHDCRTHVVTPARSSMRRPRDVVSARLCAP